MSKSSLDRAKAALAAVLPRAANLHSAGESAPTAIVNGQQIKLAWLGEGTPGNVRHFLEHDADRVDIVAARLFLPGARALLSDRGIGWVDETGAADIAIDSIIISRTGTAPKRAEKPPGWTPAVTAVAEALLCGVRATVSATQAATGLSTGSCTQALKVLTRLELLESRAKRGRESARMIKDFEHLLDEYLRAVEETVSPISLQVGVAWRAPLAGLIDIGNQWEKAGIAWASTGAMAASVMAPFLSTISSTTAYVDGRTMAELESIAGIVECKPIEGGRLTLRPFPTPTVRYLARKIDGLRVAPWPRVYADLWLSGVRGQEAAEHLREVIHG